MAAKDAFTIHRHQSVLAVGSKRTGTNLLTNPGAETGDLTGWATSTPGFTAAGDASVAPPMSGNYAFSAGAAAGSRARTLTSDRVAVTAGTRYFLGFIYGSAFHAKPYNDFKAQIRWYDAPVGGNLVGTNTIKARPVPATGQWNSYLRSKRAPVGATHAAVHFKNVYKRDPASAAASDTTALDDIFFGAVVAQTRPDLIETIKHRITGASLAFDSLMWSNNARLGYKEVTFNLYGPAEALSPWLDALMHHIEIYFGPTRRFEGYVSIVDGKVDGRPYRFSMDSLFNYIIVAGANGINRYAIGDKSIERYGRKHWKESDDSLLTEDMAQARAMYLRKRHAWPVNLKPFDDGGENNTLTVTVTGYMQTLDFLQEISVWYGYGLDKAAIIATGDGIADNLSILNVVSLIIGNEFISTDYSGVEDTGVVLRWSGGTLKRIVKDNPYTLVEDLLNTGDSTRELLVSGVWNDRKFILKPRPTALGYQRRQDAEGRWQYFDASGAALPNAMLDSGQFLKTPPLIPNWESYDDIIDDPDAAFLWEIQYDAENDIVTPIAPDADQLETGLAHAFNWVAY